MSRVLVVDDEAAVTVRAGAKPEDVGDRLTDWLDTVRELGDDTSSS